jgi:DNA-directed RNA polymerase II subunit RPB1
MLIRHGELLSGALQREVVGSGVGGLIHALWLELGPELTSEFITNSQKVVSSYLMITSFSVGVVDIVTGEHLEDLRKK